MENASDENTNTDFLLILLCCLLTMASDNVLARDVCSRQILKTTVAALCLNAGYESTQDIVLETLTEILQSYLSELGRSSQAYCEHGGRTDATARDIICALSDMGFKNKQLLKYVQKSSQSLSQVVKGAEPVSPPVLQVGQRKNFPTSISDSYNYPHLPDPHTYIRTTTGETPEDDYVILRERISTQRRDVERALTRFVARTGESHPLLPDDKNAFPLIAAQPSPFPYYSALLPSEHETMRMSLSNNVEDETEEPKETSPTKKKQKLKRGHQNQTTTSSTSASTTKSSSSGSHHHDNTGVSRHHHDQASRTNNNAATTQPSVIHNPYLRPVKLPKKRRSR